MDNRYLEGGDLKSRIASRKTASLHATPVVVSLPSALAVPAAPDMSGAFVRQTVQASPSGAPATKAAVTWPDNATLSGRLKIILGIVDSLADSMDERGTQYGDVLRDHLEDSGLLNLLKTEISFQTSVSAAPAVRQERDRAVEQLDNAALSGRLKDILGIVTSLPDSLDDSRGSYCGDGLRDILQDSGILDLSLSVASP